MGGKFERNPNTRRTYGLAPRCMPLGNTPTKKFLASVSFGFGKVWRNCFRELNRLGFTSVGDLQSTDVTFAHRRLLADMARTDELTVRMNFYSTPNPGGDALEQIKSVSAEFAHLPQSDLLSLRWFRRQFDPRHRATTRYRPISKGSAISAESAG